MSRSTIAEVLRKGRRSALAGRAAELDYLQRMTMPGGPVVAWLHGSAGMGKTALLSALAAGFADDGVRNVRLQATSVAPQEPAIVTALGAAFGRDATSIAALADALADEPGITVVMIDDVDAWRAQCAWLRTELLPPLPASLRFVFAAKTPPDAAWSTEYGPHFLEIRLGKLERADSDAAVAAAGLSPAVAERVWFLTGGHPLGLQTAIQAARVGCIDTVRDAGEIANTILHAIGDAELRRAVEACAIVRRANRALVSAILESPVPVPLSLLEAVEALPFATRDREGLYITEPVRQAILEWMSGVDAVRYQDWCRIAADWLAGRPRAADDLAFARDRREIVADGKVVELTPLEAQVLAELIDGAPAVVRREDLIERVWRRAIVGSNVVDTVIRTLRRKLGSRSDRVQTVPKAGYRYVP